MIIPFYGTCKSTIIWVIEISLRVNSIGENQHLSENVSVSAARLELVLLITKPRYVGRERDVKFVIKFYEILGEKKIEKKKMFVFVVLFVTLPPRMLK